MSINSTISIAGGVSASFSLSASALNSISVSVSSGQTNVTGNSAAIQSFSTFQSSLKGISNSVVQAGNNIHSVAKEFERIDQRIAQLPTLFYRELR
ncbi:TIGR04197 family type VII secretion effector [Enterococcus plantarum]|uniref:TIGR04197 family type VII secretion effector n=1 Tax=Enterococcus plantarum TaxID=1077675 RepID=UPI001A8CE664|nr:TIGR04197 family type VII secretion effector [Enterococcus plantarum]MBO0423644.1 TIGR04197 family type VII secretion effector [Enterococcus plantarum]